MWSVLRKAALVLIIVVIAAPLFYEPNSRERVYPLKIIASEAQVAYKAANEAAQGSRNLTATEHVITGLLAPSVLIRARGSEVEDYEALLLRAIPLMACGPTKGQCDPRETAWWKQLTNMETALVSSWATVFCATMLPFGAWRRGAALLCNLGLVVSLILFGWVCYTSAYKPTPQYFGALGFACLELRAARDMKKRRSTLEKILVPEESKADDADSAKRKNQQSKKKASTAKKDR